MANFIPVDGPIGPEEPLIDLFGRFCGHRPVYFTHLASGQMLLSFSDATEINPIATDLAATPVYGDAVLYYDEERFR